MTKLALTTFLTPIAIVIAGGAISGAIVWTGQHLPPPPVAAISPVASVSPPQPAPSAPVVDVANVKVQGEPFIGDPNAPVTIAYWFDYQCPFCRQEEETVLPQIESEYVKTGKLKIVFKDFQFLGPDSQTAALIARAVWEADPDKFATWHRAMFDHQDGENTGWGTKDDILALTKSIPGIDEAKVELLLTNNGPIYQQAIEASLAEGSSMGVEGTPAFIVGKHFVGGAVPYIQLRSLIDAALASRS